MFCTNCGNAIQDEEKFCVKCGQSAVNEEKKEIAQQSSKVPDEKWWQRLLKVAYILLYIPLLLIIPIFWNGDINTYYGYTYGQAFWYSLLTLIIYLVILRLIKIAVLYIALGQRPEWKKEIKKLF